MKKTILQQFMFATSIFMLFLLATTSCNEPSLIGSDVIDTDRADVIFTDTLTLFTSSVRDDSVRTYSSLSLLTTHLCGIIEDPIFGTSRSEINAQLRVAGSIPDMDSLTYFANISPTGTQLDSVVFVLEYDTTQFFGDPNSEQDVSVYLLDESMDNLATYYSTDNFAASNNLLFSGTVNPSQYDTTLSIPLGQDTLYPPQMRLVLNQQQAQANPLFSDILFKDGSSFQYYKNDDSLLQVLNGIKVLVENTTDPKNLMMGLKLSSSPLSGMFLYYHNPGVDTSFYRFRFTSNAAQMVNFNHEYENSFIEPYIDGTTDELDGEDYIFIQGMQGVNGKLRIPYTSELKNTIVNHAQLELTIATMLPDDDLILRDSPLEQIVLSKINEDGDLVAIADLQIAIGGSLAGIFGGNVVERTENNMIIQTYTMNISEHLQDMINGLELNDEIFISTFSKAQSANRSIIFGTGHPTYAPKLNVTYTRNQ